MALRYDAAPLSKVTRTPQGGIRCDARLTRVGIFQYKQPDGSVRKELRPDEEVFKSDSMDSFKAVPVTIGHPGEVRVDNWKDHAVGHVGDTVTHDEKFVNGTVIVQHLDAVKGIEHGSLKEVSLGYQVDLDETPGEHPVHGRYDAIQRNIRGNHVALGPEGWGRAGREVVLRLDGNEDFPTTYAPSTMLTEAEIKALQARCDAAEAEVKTLKPVVEKLTAEKEVLTAKVAELSDSKRTDSLVNERVELLNTAKDVLGEKFDCTGKTNSQIKAAVIVARNPKMKLDGKSNDFIDAAFAMALSFEVPAPPHPTLGRLSQDARDAQERQEDAVTKAETANRKASQDAWKTSNRSKLLGAN